MRWIVRVLFLAMTVVLFPQNNQQLLLPEKEFTSGFELNQLKLIASHEIVIDEHNLTQEIVPVDTAFNYRIRYAHTNIGTVIKHSAQAIEHAVVSNLTSPSNPAALGLLVDNQSPTLFIEFENDIFVEKDYYFTNGAAIGMIHPALERYFPRKLFPFQNQIVNPYYGLSLRQNMYTPINPEAISIDYGDRPFAGIMLLNYFSSGYIPSKSLTIVSEIQLGVIGKYSLAETFQTLAHHLEPTGWEFQIANDLLLNYNIELIKELVKTPTFRVNLNTKGMAGTYITSLTLGTSFSFTPGIGLFKKRPQLNHASQENQHIVFNNLPFILYGGIGGQLVAHNSTLSGGLLNTKSPYTFSSDELHSLIGQAHIGFAFVSRKSSIGIKLVYLTPEFKGGRAHQWGAISLAQQF